MFDQVLAQLAAIATLVERGVQFAKTVIRYNTWAQGYQRYIDVGLNVAFNVGLCLSWKVDLFAAADISFGSIVWAGAALTGVIASLGSTLLHEFVELLKGWRAGVPGPKAVRKSDIQ